MVPGQDDDHLLLSAYQATCKRSVPTCFKHLCRFPSKNQTKRNESTEGSSHLLPSTPPLTSPFYSTKSKKTKRVKRLAQFLRFPGKRNRPGKAPGEYERASPRARLGTAYRKGGILLARYVGRRFRPLSSGVGCLEQQTGELRWTSVTRQRVLISSILARHQCAPFI